MNKEEYLKKTSSAFNSMVVLRKLREQMALTEESNGEKRKRQEFENPIYQSIYDTLYDVVIPGFFWESLIYTICFDMQEYHFEDIPSVVDDKSSFFSSNRAQSDYFSKISLLEHIYNVMSSFRKLKIYINPIYHSTVALGCVMHDHGKSKELCAKLNDFEKTAGFKHAQASSVYVRKLKHDYFKHNEEIIKQHSGIGGGKCYAQLELLDRVAEAVSLHHAKRNKKYSLEYYIQAIDHDAREKEWETFLNKEVSPYNLLLKGENE